MRTAPALLLLLAQNSRGTANHYGRMVRMGRPNQVLLCGIFLLHAGVKGQQPSPAVQAEVRQGIDALERSNFSAAQEHLSRALEADPNLSEARANLGLAYYADRKYAQAIEAF
ncbi:MAG: hypothetical protein DMG27_07260, partial [Acidobacteria bacterium]